MPPTSRTRPEILPAPPVAEGVGLPWDVASPDPVGALAEARARVGDTFVVDSGPDRWLFTFSPAGVRSFYALPEADASKGLADFRMLTRKLPDEIFAGRRTFPHDLFNRTDRTSQLTGLQVALDAAVIELGDEGTLDLFAFTRRLGHRIGLASWGGPGATAGSAFERLVTAFDVLDGAEAFVHPDAMAAVAASGKAAERDALAEVADVVRGAVTTLRADPALATDHPLFARIDAAWVDAVEPERSVGVAYDIALLHIASMSNLFAALGWFLVDLLDHPAERQRVADGDTERAEQCALESTRLAQRSIMARYTLTPVSLDTGELTIEVPAGMTIATLLPLLNTTAAPGLERWDPDRWDRWRLRDAAGLPTPELVTAFGHGRHTCPAQPFSLSAMTAIAQRLFAGFDVERIDATRPVPEPAQIGGVARAHRPCRARYRRR